MPPKGLHRAQFATFKYKFADHGGAQGAITLSTDNNELPNGKLPDNAQILRVRTECIEAVTSGGAATIKLGITGNDDAFEGATAYTDNSYDTPGTVDVKESEVPLKVDNSSGVSVLATVATADLTAGEFDVHVEYLPGS